SHQADDPATKPDCLACHMPPISIERGHGLMHDHRLAVPDPALTRLAGIPNACAECHGDQPAAFAESALQSWKAQVPWRRAPAMAIHQARRGGARRPWPSIKHSPATRGPPPPACRRRWATRPFRGRCVPPPPGCS
ncbi:MAG: hypothetical protein ACYTGX_13040, partial [Planctomycetota bacterium]